MSPETTDPRVVETIDLPRGTRIVHFPLPIQQDVAALILPPDVPPLALGFLGETIERYLALVADTPPTTDAAVDSDDPGDFPFKCPSCDLDFQTATALLSHVTSTHLADEADEDSGPTDEPATHSTARRAADVLVELMTESTDNGVRLAAASAVIARTFRTPVEAEPEPGENLVDLDPSNMIGPRFWLWTDRLANASKDRSNVRIGWLPLGWLVRAMQSKLREPAARDSDWHEIPDGALGDHIGAWTEVLRGAMQNGNGVKIPLAALRELVAALDSDAEEIHD